MGVLDDFGSCGVKCSETVNWWDWNADSGSTLVNIWGDVEQPVVRTPVMVLEGGINLWFSLALNYHVSIDVTEVPVR